MFQHILKNFPPILYIRHGQSMANTGEKGKKDQHTAAIALTPLGEQQATENAAFLQQWIEQRDIHRFWVCISTYRRTMQTAEPFIRRINHGWRKPEVMYDDLLIEQRGGIYERTEPLSHERWEAQRKLASEAGTFHHFPMPGAETSAEAANRQQMWLIKTALALQNTPAKQRPKAILVYGHGLTGGHMFMHLNGKGWEWVAENGNFPNTAVRLFDDGRDHGFIYQPKSTALKIVA